MYFDHGVLEIVKFQDDYFWSKGVSFFAELLHPKNRLTKPDGTHVYNHLFNMGVFCCLLLWVGGLGVSKIILIL